MPGHAVRGRVGSAVVAAIVLAGCTVGVNPTPTAPGSDTAAPVLETDATATDVVNPGPTSPPAVLAPTTPSAKEESSTPPTPGTSGQQEDTSVPNVTTPVVPPGGAGIGDTVPEIVVTTLAPSPLAAASQLGRIEVTIVETRSVTVEPVGPGEVAGDGLAVTVAYRNVSEQSLDLAAMTVTLTGSDNQVAVASTGAPAALPTGDLAAGATAQGVYVFTVAPAERQPVTISVTDFNNAASAVFVGNVA